MSSFGRVLTLQQVLDSFPEDRPVGATAIRDLVATLMQGGVIPQTSVSNAISAHAGGGQASATALTSGINRITGVATAADSVKLPASLPGIQIHVSNAHATNSANVFPATGDAINALVANAAFALASGKNVIFSCAVSGQWHAVLSA